MSKLFIHTLIFVVFTLMLAAMLAAQAPSPVVSSPIPASLVPVSKDAAAILDRYVEVTGGKAAYQRLTSEVIEGTLSLPEQNLSGKLIRYALPPDKEYSLVDMPQVGKFESGFTNGVAWDKTSMMGPRVKTGEEMLQAQREARFNSALVWRTIYVKAEAAGVETVEGEECDKVILTPKAGKPETQYYSRVTGLLVKTVMVAASPMGDVNAESIVSNYKPYGGILYPTRSVQKAGQQKVELNVTKVTFNEPIPAEYFETPAEIKALVGKPVKVAK